MQGEKLHSAHASAIYALASREDGVLLSAGGDGMVFAWDPVRPDEVRAIAKAPAPVLSILPHRDMVCMGTSVGEFIVVDPLSKRPIQQLLAHGKGIYAIAGIDKERVACAGGDGVLSIWGRSENGTYDRHRMIALSDAKLRGLAPSVEHGLLAVACGDGTIRVLDTTHFNEVATFTGHIGGANAVAFHPSKPVLVSGGKDGHIRFWDLFTDHREMMAIVAHRSTIYAMAFDARGLQCATASRDKTAKLWNASTMDPMDRLAAQQGGHTHSVNAVIWAGDRLYTGGDDRKLVRWDPA